MENNAGLRREYEVGERKRCETGLERKWGGSGVPERTGRARKKVPRPEEEENEKERNERKLMLAAVYKVSIEGKNKEASWRGELEGERDARRKEMRRSRAKPSVFRDAREKGMKERRTHPRNKKKEVAITRPGYNYMASASAALCRREVWGMSEDTSAPG